MRRYSRHRQRGVALIWVVITFTVLMGLTGLALDTARVLLAAHELQNAADAAALAGAQYVRTDQEQARAAALAIAAANKAENVSVVLPDNPENLEDGKIVLGRFDRETKTFEATTSAPNAVKVTACRTSSQNGALPLIFGPIFNVSTSNVSRQAIAMVGGGTGAGLIALDTTQKGALTINGTVTVNVNNGAIVVDSSDSQAMITNGTPTLNGPEINVVGATDATTASVAAAQGIDLNTGSSVVPDPLATLPAPSTSGMTNYGTVSIAGGTGTTSLQPGYYPGGISQSATGSTLNLAPGIYILDGAGLKITGGNMNAYGVMFYIKGTGVTTLTGNGNVNITGIDPALYSYPAGTELYEGMSIFQNSDPNIKPANKSDSTIVGTSNLNLSGTLYFRSNHLDLSGTSAGVGNQLIADTITISGSGNLTINYDGRNVAAGNRVYLVQ